MKSFIMALTSVATLNFLATGLEHNPLAAVNLAVGCITLGLAIGLGIGSAIVAVATLVCETERVMARK